MRSTDAMAWDFVYIDVKCCAESEFEMLQVSRRLVFALWSKNDTSDHHFETKRVLFGLFLGIKTVRFVRRLRLGKIWLHHVKERIKVHLGGPKADTQSRASWICKGKSARKEAKREKSGLFWPIFASRKMQLLPYYWSVRAVAWQEGVMTYAPSAPVSSASQILLTASESPF